MLLNFLSCNSVRIKSKLRFIYQSLGRNVKYNKSVLRESSHSSLNSGFKTRNPCNIDKDLNRDVTKINVNVQNNVVLYKNEQTRDFVLLKIVFFGWFSCNTALAYGTYNPEYMSSWFKYASWMEYVKKNGSNLLYFAYAITLGPLFSLLLYFLNQRFVRYIILHKGGKEVSIITNHLYKSNNTYRMPISQVKTTMARDKATNYLPLKLRDHKFFFLVDGHGQFVNRYLFDYTVGEAKRW